MQPDQKKFIAYQRKLIFNHTPLNPTNLLKTQKKYMHYRKSIHITRFLAMLNFSYSVVGIIFACLFFFRVSSLDILCDPTIVRFGFTCFVICPILMAADLLAHRGLIKWRQSFLIPWLFVYPAIISYFFAHSMTGIIFEGLNLSFILLLVCAFIGFIFWEHISIQHDHMEAEKPTNCPSEDTEMGNFDNYSSLKKPL